MLQALAAVGYVDAPTRGKSRWGLGAGARQASASSGAGSEAIEGDQGEEEEGGNGYSEAEREEVLESIVAARAEIERLMEMDSFPRFQAQVLKQRG